MKDAIDSGVKYCPYNDLWIFVVFNILSDLSFSALLVTTMVNPF